MTFGIQEVPLLLTSWTVDHAVLWQAHAAFAWQQPALMPLQMIPGSWPDLEQVVVPLEGSSLLDQQGCLALLQSLCLPEAGHLPCSRPVQLIKAGSCCTHGAQLLPQGLRLLLVCLILLCQARPVLHPDVAEQGAAGRSDDAFLMSAAAAFYWSQVKR